MDKKICGKCKIEKDLSMFYKNKSKKNGIDNWCKVCYKQYRDNNTEKKKEYNKQYYKENTESRKEYIKQYQENNPEKCRAKNRRRRARKQQLNEYFDIEMETFVLDAFNHQCFNCGSIEDLCIDHFKPLSKGYKLTVANALVLCKSCNSSKKDKMPRDFFGVGKAKLIKQLLMRNHMRWLGV